MSYFSGEYECKLDAKGRLVLPAKIKACLPVGSEASIVLMRGFEPCLVLYPLPEWQKQLERVMALNEFVEEERNFQRSFLRGNTELELDANGRFLVPRTMLKHASIDKEAVMVGVGNRVEIWGPNTYEQYLVNDQKAFSAMAERVLGKAVQP